MAEHIDPFILFAEGRGVFLTARQLKFCQVYLRANDSVRAAKDAGYPDHEDTADVLYAEHRALLEAYRNEIGMDFDTVLGVHRRATTATIVVRDADGCIVETKPDYKTQNMGARGLAEVLGFNAAKRIEAEVHNTNDLPPDLEEMVERVYNQARS